MAQAHVTPERPRPADVAPCGAAGTKDRHVHFARTKFLLHAGLAFGAFHRYIYKPFLSGGFTPPLRHKLAIVKAGAAALFAYHEIKIALIDAQSSALLSKLVSPADGSRDTVQLAGSASAQRSAQSLRDHRSQRGGLEGRVA